MKYTVLTKAHQAEVQYVERNKLDLAVPKRPLANIVKGLHHVKSNKFK